MNNLNTLYARTPGQMNLLGDEIVIGKDVLELVTGSMYVDPLCIYREYIQNAADSIDEGINKNDYQEFASNISIELDHPSRSIKIRDNGCGVSNKNFLRTLTAIGGSQKRGKGQRGFRGVGRLSGLGYCQELVFRSKSINDTCVYELRWDGRKLKDALRSSDFTGSIQDLIKEITELKITQDVNISPSFFEVELIKVGRLKNDLLLNEDEVRTYIAQVGPVPFHPEFELGKVIESKLKEYHDFKTYNVSLNDGKGLVFRPHQMEFLVSGELRDKFTDVEFFEIEGSEGSPDALGWILNHSYLGAISKKSGIAGIRFRTGNIQVGSQELVADLFPESRFNSWSVSEIQILSNKVLPNGRRDDFEYSLHYQNILGQMSLNASRLAKKCRDKSSARNRVKIARDYLVKCSAELEFTDNEIFSFVSRKLALEKASRLMKLASQAIQSELFSESERNPIIFDINEIANKIESRYESTTFIEPENSITKEYEEIFGHIHEICRDSGEAHRIVEQLVNRLKL
jgi:Histidine kinase-, DNA gyrase B-, and HSP90-like ATPase